MSWQINGARTQDSLVTFDGAPAVRTRANTWQRNLSPSTDFASPFRYNIFGFAVGGPIWVPASC